jgi:hypothetical protein
MKISSANKRIKTTPLASKYHKFSDILLLIILYTISTNIMLLI